MNDPGIRAKRAIHHYLNWQLDYWRLYRRKVSTMNEEERRLEILKAEEAIRELARKMAQASESTRQADNTRGVMEAAVRSMDEFNTRFQELTESWNKSFEEKSKSMDQAKKSLDMGAKDLQQAHERLAKTAGNL